MVLADRPYSARLRAFDAFLLVDRQAHLAPHLELIKSVADHAVPVEVDLLAVGDRNKAIVIEQPRDHAVRRCRVRLDVAAHFSRMVLKTPNCCIEGCLLYTSPSPRD